MPPPVIPSTLPEPSAAPRGWRRHRTDLVVFGGLVVVIAVADWARHGEPLATLGRRVALDFVGFAVLACAGIPLLGLVWAALRGRRVALAEFDAQHGDPAMRRDTTGRPDAPAV